jgi:hypothetical protein
LGTMRTSSALRLPQCAEAVSRNIAPSAEPYANLRGNAMPIRGFERRGTLR